MTALEGAVAVRDTRLVYLSSDPHWKPLRAMPRFTALLRQLRLNGLPPGLTSVRRFVASNGTCRFSPAPGYHAHVLEALEVVLSFESASPSDSAAGVREYLAARAM